MVFCFGANGLFPQKLLYFARSTQNTRFSRVFAGKEAKCALALIVFWEKNFVVVPWSASVTFETMISAFGGFLFDQKCLIFEEMALFWPKGIKIPILENKKDARFQWLENVLGNFATDLQESGWGDSSWIRTAGLKYSKAGSIECTNSYVKVTDPTPSCYWFLRGTKGHTRLF